MARQRAGQARSEPPLGGEAAAAGKAPSDFLAMISHGIGMNDHIAKPFDREQMYEVIGRWTARA